MGDCVWFFLVVGTFIVAFILSAFMDDQEVHGMSYNMEYFFPSVRDKFKI